LGAGYLFTYGEFFKEIKLDESIQHIFSGEEILLGILAYTHGWDIYSPAYMNVFHYYNHKKPNWHTDILSKKNKSSVIERKSYEKLKELLDTDVNNPCMGSDRKISNFWKELGFNRKGTTLKDKFPASSKLNRCDKTIQIPYPIKEFFYNRYD